MITPEQIRAARAILKWTAKELSEKAGLSLPTVQRMERDHGTDSSLGKNIMAVQQVLENAGIEFIPENGGGVGVRMKKGSSKD